MEQKPGETLKKNEQIHVYVTTYFKNKIRDQADSKNLTLSDYCISVLNDKDQLDRIESLLKRLLDSIK